MTILCFCFLLQSSRTDLSGAGNYLSAARLPQLRTNSIFDDILGEVEEFLFDSGKASMGMSAHISESRATKWKTDDITMKTAG